MYNTTEEAYAAGVNSGKTWRWGNDKPGGPWFSHDLPDTVAINAAWLRGWADGRTAASNNDQQKIG